MRFFFWMISKISSHSFFLKLFNIPSILSTSLLRFLFPILFLVILNTFPQEGDIAAGKQLFNTNCASCHKLDRKMTGPALRNVDHQVERLVEGKNLGTKKPKWKGLVTLLWLYLPDTKMHRMTEKHFMKETIRLSSLHIVHFCWLMLPNSILAISK